ncbi:MAG: hypothetical protein ACFCU3_11400 [Verrucomicrobiales bacterium]
MSAPQTPNTPASNPEKPEDLLKLLEIERAKSQNARQIAMTRRSTFRLVLLLLMVAMVLAALYGMSLLENLKHRARQSETTPSVVVP